MKKFVKKVLATVLVAAMLICGLPFCNLMVESSAATFSDINASSVFLTQPSGSVTCTLYAATMMMRRYSMIRGDGNWASITADSVDDVAWAPGLYYSFTYSNSAKGISAISVSHGSLPTGEANRNTLISLLQSHPEGIVIYYTGWPHAVLLTDYTDGVFYCADPAKSATRIPLSQAGSNVTLTNVSEYWYITSPRVYLTDVGPHTCDKGTFKGAGGTHPHNSYWYCSICGENWREWWTSNYLESCEECINHTCDKGTWVYFGLSHPHSDYYKCSLCGEDWMDSASSNYYSSCDQCVNKTYTLTYNANGGSGAPASQTVNQGSSVTLSSTVPVKDGNTFLGWDTEADGTGTSYSAGETIVINADTTLYARWIRNSYTINYKANGGDVEPDSITVYGGGMVELATPTKYVTITYNANGGTNAPSAAKAYYECLGWSKSSTATSATYKCGEQYNLTADVTLYAVWANKAYTNLSSATPTRDGYKFLGWATSGTATQAQFNPGHSVNLGIDTVLYAVWQKNESPAPTPTPTVIEEDISLNYKDTMTFSVPVTLESSNPKVASVSENKITAVGTGSADVTATLEDGTVYIYHINVSYSFLQWIIIIVLFGWIWY